MKKNLLLVGLTAAGALTGTHLQAQTYTAGDVVIYRVGDGTAALTNAGTAVIPGRVRDHRRHTCPVH